MEVSRIIKLEAQNVKKLKTVEITPEGNLVILGGKNGQGKTSALDSIEYALAGKSAQCDRPVRAGEKKARIVCDLGDLKVTRTITAAGGGTLKVTGKNGTSFSSPQRVLDELTGEIAFDPLAFSRMDRKKQLEVLKKLVGLDFSDLETRKKKLYDDRTEKNREIKKLETRLSGLTEYPDAPENLIVVSELMTELERRREVNRQHEESRQDLETTREKVEEKVKEVDRLKTELEREQKALNALRAAANELGIYTQDLIDENEQGIQEQINNAETENDKFRSNQQHTETQTELKRLQDETEDLTLIIETIDETKAKALSEADFPVAGLSFDDDGILFNGIPFDQASDSEKLRVSVAMGLEMNPTLKVLLIRDGSLLDKNSLRMIAEMAEEADAQVWIERVGEGEECQVIFEEGEIRSGNGEGK